MQITTGEGVETYPTPLASGKYLATLSADWNMPQSVGVWKHGAEAKQKIVFPVSMPGFPKDAHVKPEIVITKADDGLEIHNQLFLPKDLKPGERRPAIVFVHGGPPRQMMPAYHYMQFYHWAYGINQWLANQGYIVMSINYRLGVGYGHSFQRAANGGAQGNSEYQDVLAGGKYLQTRPDVDPNRVGIWGLSYGGLLTAEALARNSDIFKAGVDLAGVHLEGNSLDPESVSYKSSAISAIDGWKSPVLLVQGDDDRNVSFLQTVGLVQLLRQRECLSRTDRLSRRRARIAAAQPVAVHAGPDGNVSTQVPRGIARDGKQLKSFTAGPRAASRPATNHGSPTANDVY